MAISKKLVDTLGGTIKIRVKRNVGSTFILVLPFAIDKDYENASVQSEPETPNVEGMHVLLVEDNELNLEIAGSLSGRSRSTGDSRKKWTRRHWISLNNQGNRRLT